VCIWTVFGRGAKVAGTLLLPLLADSPVELEDFGVLEAERAGSLLANADVQLFVRSGLSSRRGSGIAGIACGLPILGFSDAETAFSYHRGRSAGSYPWAIGKAWFANSFWS